MQHIMMGYLKEQAKTAEAIDSEGFLHSGDVGAIDRYGLLHITGRIKELIITVRIASPRQLCSAVMSRLGLILNDRLTDHRRVARTLRQCRARTASSCTLAVWSRML